MECELANEDDELVWLINGKPINEDSRCKVDVDGLTRVLKISDVKPSDNGTVIVAKVAEHVSQTTLLVEDTPVEFVERLPRRSYGKVGEDVKLVVAVNHPSETVKWYVDDQMITEDETHVVTIEDNLCTLCIKNPGYEQAGRYSVKADSSETTTTLVMQGAPQIESKEKPEEKEILVFEAHENLVFSIPFKAEPEPVIECLMNNELLTTGTKVQINLFGDTVRFCKRKINKQDAGDYTIKIKNEYGEATKTFTVKIKGTSLTVCHFKSTYV